MEQQINIKDLSLDQLKVMSWDHIFEKEVIENSDTFKRYNALLQSLQIINQEIAGRKEKSIEENVNHKEFIRLGEPEIN